MAAKFIVLSLAVCSAYANVCVTSCFQDGSFGLGDPFSSGSNFVSAPVVADTFSAPAAPSFVSAPAVNVAAAPSFVAAPVVQATPVVSLGDASDAFGGVSSLSGFGSSGSFAGALASNGPSPSSQALPVIQAAPVTMKVVEAPLIRLPSPPIPGPKVIRHKCSCTKTIVKPQVVQRTITIPRIQRYVKQTYRPVVENVAYSARPTGFDNAASSGVASLGSDSLGSVFSGSALSGASLSAPVFSAPVMSMPSSDLFSGSVASAGAFSDAGASSAFELPSFDSVLPSSRCH